MRIHNNVPLSQPGAPGKKERTAPAKSEGAASLELSGSQPKKTEKLSAGQMQDAFSSVKAKPAAFVRAQSNLSPERVFALLD